MVPGTILFLFFGLRTACPRPKSAEIRPKTAAPLKSVTSTGARQKPSRIIKSRQEASGTIRTTPEARQTHQPHPNPPGTTRQPDPYNLEGAWRTISEQIRHRYISGKPRKGNRSDPFNSPFTMVYLLPKSAPKKGFPGRFSSIESEQLRDCLRNPCGISASTFQANRWWVPIRP